MYVHTPTRSLVLKVRDPFAVRELLPNASRVIAAPDGHNLAVRWNLDSAKLLRNIGVAAPSPIKNFYKWPGRYKPLDHQVEMASFMSLNDKCFNLGEQGVGKTAATLWAIDYLMNEGAVKRALIMCPLSSMRLTWERDIFEVLPHRVVSVIHGTAERRIKNLKRPVDFYILNHDGIDIESVAKEVRKRQDIDLIVVDEASFFRNAEIDRYRFLKWVAEKKARLWLLTGTPCPNAPTDAWALSKLVCPHLSPQFFGRFRDETMDKYDMRWAPKSGSSERAYEIMQPAIRFKKRDCLDLPPLIGPRDVQTQLSKEQKDAVKLMRDEMTMLAKTTKINAVNGADKITKLRQILCVGEGTPVLTDRGWLAIEQVSMADRIWDGVAWVRHRGVSDNGIKHVIVSGGVCMTPDHEVLCGQSSNRPTRAAVRLPDCGRPSWFDHRTIDEGNLALSVHLRKAGYAGKPESSRSKEAERQALWVQARFVTDHSRDEFPAPTPHLGEYEASLPEPDGQRLPQLRSARNNGVRTVAALLLRVLGGYARNLLGLPDTRSRGQQRPLQQGELPLGTSKNAGEQHARQPSNRHAWGAHECRAGGVVVRGCAPSSVRETERRVADGRGVRSARKVYDILNCGPRNRFVVRGVGGELQIVHNCGTVKDPTTGEYHRLDCPQRVRDLRNLISQANAKVLVIVPFTGILRVLAEELPKPDKSTGLPGYSVEVMNGDVSANERVRIVTRFKQEKDPHVLVCHPKVMAHGLNLTEADTTIFYAPIYSNDEYAQVIERFNRLGQKHTMNLLRMVGHPIEASIYRVVDDRGTMQNSILELYQQVIDGKDDML